MAVAVTQPRRRCGLIGPNHLIGLIGVIGLCAGTAPAWAAGPATPFEPLRPTPAAAASAPSPAAAEQGDPANGSAQARGLDPTGLQGVHRAGASALALIDGRWLSVGSQVRGARLVRIQGQQATLRYPDGRVEVMTLHATATKPAAMPAQAAAPLQHQPARTP